MVLKFDLKKTLIYFLFTNMDHINGNIIVEESNEGYLKNQKLSLLRDGEVVAQATFPPKKDEDINEEQLYRDLCFRNLHCSSKFVNYCELTRKGCNNYDLICDKILGSDTFICVPYGVVNYHKDEGARKIILDKLFETEYNIINFFQFNTKFLVEIDFDISVRRSSGIIDHKCHIPRDNSIRYSKTKNVFGFNVNVTSDSWEILSKFVTLSDIKKYNPTLFPITVYMDNDVPDWMLEERNSWMNQCEENLKSNLDSDVIIKIENKYS